MKKLFLGFISLVLISGFVFLAGCTKEDSTAPVITIIGDDPLMVTLNDNNWVDPGATAIDNNDGAVQVMVDASDVSENHQAQYDIIYTATDSDGNIATAIRKVNVRNDTEEFAADYDADCVVPYPGGTSYPYVEVISSDNFINGKLWFDKFGGLADCNVYGTVVGDNITIPSQTITNVGTPSADRTFNGSATISPDKTTIVIDYVETVGVNSDNGRTTLIKQ